ncbi:MAG: hypothetical protein HY276_01980 [Ignavibacteriales bacterium]|nr:hypothetical protein [Ignavibacteriales bacterium]
MKETFVRCGHPQLDALYPRIKNFLLQDITEYNMFGTKVRGYRTPDAPSLWIRDYSDMMRAFKYWEHDMKTIVEHFAETQTAKGWLFDYFTMTPEKVPCEKENWAKYVRVPVEADVEYRFIKAIYLAWQATGDDKWMKNLLPHMEKALQYILTDDWRWDKKTKLVKRGYTMDTWDFDYTAGRHPWLNFQINERTFWGIMHGDNSGYYESFNQMAAFYVHLGNKKRAEYWKKFAESFRRRANKLCFNGRFYTHHVHLVPVKIDGVDESEQLTLSNPMDINRGMATHEIAVAIVREYQRRKETANAFAEWFSVDPPFPAGIYGDEKIIPGAYCNGGIMPLVGGELARAAFEHGFEEYGVQQLLNYEELTKNNESYLWYFPNGQHATIETSTSPDASPTDAWGSSAMLYALMEGLAGVVDMQKLFKHVTLAPRWIAAGSDEASACCVYGASGASFEYSFSHNASGKNITLELQGTSVVDLHALLPKGAKATGVTVNGKKLQFKNSRVENSPYVDARITLKKKAAVEIRYR